MSHRTDRMVTSRELAVRLLALLSLLSFNFMFIFVAADAAGVISVEPVASADDPLRMLAGLAEATGTGSGGFGPDQKFPANTGQQSLVNGTFLPSSLREWPEYGRGQTLKAGGEA